MESIFLFQKTNHSYLNFFGILNKLSNFIVCKKNIFVTYIHLFILLLCVTIFLDSTKKFSITKISSPNCQRWDTIRIIRKKRRRKKFCLKYRKHSRKSRVFCKVRTLITLSFRIYNWKYWNRKLKKENGRTNTC